MQKEKIYLIITKKGFYYFDTLKDAKEFIKTLDFWDYQIYKLFNKQKIIL